MVEKNKAEFVDLLKKNVHRYGVDSLVESLEKTDFFESPASTKYHGSYEGGLVVHSLNVYYELINVMKLLYGPDWQQRHSLESVTLVALLHDICKAGKYQKDVRNKKNPKTGVWESVPCYVWNTESFKMGHGASSVFHAMQYIELTPEEAQAIYWHMGAFDISQYSTVSDMSDTFSENTLAFALHMADMISTHVTENEKFKPVEIKNT